MSKYLPVAFRALDRRRGSGTLEGFTSDQPVIGKIEWHGDEMTDLAHAFPVYFGIFRETTPIGGWCIDADQSPEKPARTHDHRNALQTAIAGQGEHTG
jgi:hypothetical protein